MIFALGITPKIYLHQLFAVHRDIAHASPGSADQIDKAGYRCSCDNQVVELPYLTGLPVIELTPPQFFRVRLSTANISIPSSPHFIFRLRGPPCLM
jgi:hypothetical protein